MTWNEARNKPQLGCTSGGAEADMLNEVLGKAKETGFVIKEMICDKDSSTNVTICRKG